MKKHMEASRASTTRDRLKLIIPSLVAIILFILSLFLFFIPRLEQIVIREEKNAIEDLVSLPLQICSSFAGRVEAGELSELNAKRRAAGLIRDMHYGRENKDYFWILDTGLVLVMHPYRADLAGTDVSDYRDKDGTAVFVEMKEVAEREGAGYVSYNWQIRDETEELGEKLSYVVFFEDWNWIIGTGIYLSELKGEFASITRSILVVSIAVILGISLLLLSVIRQGIMLQNRRLAAAAELSKSKLQYQQLIQLMHEGFAIVDSAGRFTFVNRRLCDMLGYAESEILERKVVDFVQEGYLQTFEEEMEKRRQGLEMSYRLEWKTKEGQRLVTIVAPRIYYDSSGTQTGSFAVITDITEIKLSEEKLTALVQEKTVLLKEVHHRVKNNLQLISSLFNLQYLGTADEKTGGILKDSQLRIQTISRVHEFLYQSENFTDIDMCEFMNQLIIDSTAALAADRNSEIRFSSDVSPLIFPIDRAIPCGLIMNELITNAVKHAFPPELVIDGEKQVNLFLKREDGYISFGVEDNGRGFSAEAAAQQSESLGMELVTILAEQLRGELVFPESESLTGSRVEVRIAD